MKPLLTVSDEAKNWLEDQLQGQDYMGVMVRVNSKGCAGGEYEFTPVTDDTDVSDCDKTEDNGLTIYFPRIDMLKLIGSELVLFQDKFNTRLDFNNPNEDSRCGCGESVSFTVNRSPS
jgi:iron-sulfur cluster assembly protein